MLKMSFYNGTLNRADLREFIIKTEKDIKYTHGLGYSYTHKRPISKDEALEIVEDNHLLDAEETEEYLHLDNYSGN